MQYFEPNFIDEALVLLDRFGPAARVLAGGTLIGWQLRTNAEGVEALINLRRLSELREIDRDGDIVRVGALATARQMAADPILRSAAPLVMKAAASIGARQLRAAATIGGNVCGGDPAADLSAVLLACDASCVIAGAPDGPASVPLQQFLRPHGNGLRPGELLTAVEFPAGANGVYEKLTTRRAFEMALVAVAVRLRVENGVIVDPAIALAGAGPTALRATAAEATLIGQPPAAEGLRAAARVAAEADAQPQGDLRASADFRRHLVFVLTERALAHAVRPAEDAA